MVPKPFAKVIHAYGPPIPPPAHDTPEDVEETRAALERALNTLHQDLEDELGLHVFEG